MSEQAATQSVSKPSPVSEAMAPAASETQKVAAPPRDSDTVEAAVLGYN